MAQSRSFDPDIDRAYQNGAFIAGGAAFPQRWAAAAQSFRDRAATVGAGCMLQPDVAYGPSARQRLDLFRPDGLARGLLVFVHGGYWLAFGRETFSHLAAGALARGWACAMPSYRLAPEVRIADITRDAAAAVRAAAAMVEGPVVVAGHSAGGHLAARMGCTDIDIPNLRRVVPISPLGDLAPLMQTAMQNDLRLDDAEVAAESPCRLTLRAGVDAHVWVGGQERPAFLWQARRLSEDWGCRWTIAPDRHHFDVIDDLADPDSALTRLCTLDT